MIDYFHDMSLLKEGDGVNFQKASCTLDGCVKIYTSRVDGVATETGRMLSSLADSGNKKRKEDEVEGEEGEADDEDVEDGAKKRARKKVSAIIQDDINGQYRMIINRSQTQKTAEATLATTFAQLQLKKMELEFSVDPLFKKASADFDEGGAKGLLLNHLAIDGEGRIVFDSSDDTKEEDRNTEQGVSIDVDRDRGEEASDPIPGVQTDQQDGEINIGALGTKFIADLAVLDEQKICPSLETFELGDNNGTLDLPFLRAPPEDRKSPKKGDHQEHQAQSGIFSHENNAFGFEEDDNPLGGFDLPPGTGFGEGGEAWAREAVLEPQKRVQVLSRLDDGVSDDVEKGEIGDYDPNSTHYGVTLSERRQDDHENILRYFDEALKKQWAGPEHWKIKRIKEATKDDGPKHRRKEKEPFEIDFSTPITQSLADMLYTPANSNSAISLPKAQIKSKTRNLLPDDKHFNSRQLLRLFLKPKARLGSRKAGLNGQSKPVHHENGMEADEAYWAQNKDLTNAEEPERQADYDANFFQDDGLGQPGGLEDDDDDIFADAREMFSPPIEGAEGSPVSITDVLASNKDEAFGAQLVAQSRRTRPEYVQYARVAKKVDVRRLKEELWRGIGYEQVIILASVIYPSKAHSFVAFTTADTFQINCASCHASGRRVLEIH